MEVKGPLASVCCVTVLRIYEMHSPLTVLELVFFVSEWLEKVSATRSIRSVVVIGAVRGSIETNIDSKTLVKCFNLPFRSSVVFVESETHR
jgi:hypothetical protein